MLRGQNLGDDDVTLVAAGRDIKYTTPRDPLTGTPLISSNGIELAGPGSLEVIAGRDIDLGTSKGIVTHGNILLNPLLPDGGASITMIAGAPLFASGAKPHVTAGSGSSPIRFEQQELIDYVRQVTGDATVDASNVAAKFNALTGDQQWPLIMSAFFTAL